MPKRCPIALVRTCNLQVVSFSLQSTSCPNMGRHRVNKSEKQTPINRQKQVPQRSHLKTLESVSYQKDHLVRMVSLLGFKSSLVSLKFFETLLSSKKFVLLETLRQRLATRWNRSGSIKRSSGQHGRRFKFMRNHCANNSPKVWVLIQNF